MQSLEAKSNKNAYILVTLMMTRYLRQQGDSSELIMQAMVLLLILKGVGHLYPPAESY